MKYKLLVLVVSIVFSINTHAYISSDGDEFTSAYNNHGAVLTTVYEKHYWIGLGVNTKMVSKKAVIYLGKKCDISSEFYGEGKWFWANGGFILEFKNKSLAFGRQELNINNGGGCSI